MNRLYGTGIVRSLILSIRQMMRGTITVQYPHEKLVLPERARWSVAITLDEEGSHKCTACRACEKACPDHVILLDIRMADIDGLQLLEILKERAVHWPVVMLPYEFAGQVETHWPWDK